MATIELNRRRVLVALLVLGLAAAGAGAGTLAFFSDTESSTNRIQAGTLNLESPISGTIDVNGTVPDTWHNTTLSTTYQGSVAAEVDMNVTLSEPTTEPSESNNAAVQNDLNATEFGALIEVNTATADVGGTTEDLLGRVSNTNSNSYIDLVDLEAAAPFDNVTSADANDGETVELTLDLYFVSSAGNDAQADGVNATVDFTAEQRQADP